MARIAGVELPANKRVEVGLMYIYGMMIHLQTGKASIFREGLTAALVMQQTGQTA